jgi:hypothetical protein
MRGGGRRGAARGACCWARCHHLLQPSACWRGRLARRSLPAHLPRRPRTRAPPRPATLQVRVWSPTGEALAASNHHRAGVEALLCTPLDGGGGGGCKLWSGGSDATLFCWPGGPGPPMSAGGRGSGRSAARGAAASKRRAADALRRPPGAADASGSGLLDASAGRQQRPSGQRAIKCLAQVGQAVWAGCDDGQVFAYGACTERLLGSWRAHGAAVLAIAPIGSQVGGVGRAGGAAAAASSGGPCMWQVGQAQLQPTSFWGMPDARATLAAPPSLPPHAST